MSNVIDFDAFRAEQHQEPVRLVIGGKTYELASSLPASLAMDIVRMNAGGKGAKKQLDEDYLQTIGEALLGEHFRPILDEHRITLAELPELIKMVFAAYSGTTPGEEGAPPNREARRRASKSPRSSATGSSSRRTSPASITSISPGSSPN